MQHLDRRLEHFDELEQPLIREAQSARIAVSVRVVLRVMLELADVNLADERRNILVVLVARLRFGDRDLAQRGRYYARNAELRGVAAIFLEPLDGPRRHDPGQVATGNAVLLFERLAELRGG